MTIGGTIHSFIFDIDYLPAAELCVQSVRSLLLCWLVSGRPVALVLLLRGGLVLNRLGGLGSFFGNIFIIRHRISFREIPKNSSRQTTDVGHQLKITMPLPKNLWLKAGNQDTRHFKCTTGPSNEVRIARRFGLAQHLSNAARSERGRQLKRSYFPNRVTIPKTIATHATPKASMGPKF
jgi:hypothetical protein